MITFFECHPNIAFLHADKTMSLCDENILSGDRDFRCEKSPKGVKRQKEVG